MSGTNNRIMELRDKLNQGQDVEFAPTEDPHNITNLLKNFLRELPNSLLLKENYALCLELIGSSFDSRRHRFACSNDIYL